MEPLLQNAGTGATLAYGLALLVMYRYEGSERWQPAGTPGGQRHGHRGLRRGGLALRFCIAAAGMLLLYRMG